MAICPREACRRGRPISAPLASSLLPVLLSAAERTETNHKPNSNMRRKHKYDERSSTRVLVDSLTHCQHFLLLQERLQLRCVCYRWLQSSRNIVPNCKVAWDTQRRLKRFWQRFEIRPQPAGAGGVGAPLLQEDSLNALLKHGYTFVDNVIPLSAFVRMRGGILGTANAHRSRARNGTDHTAQYNDEGSDRDAHVDKSVEAECGIRWQYSFQGADTRWRDDLIMFVPKADAGSNALGLSLHMHAQTTCFLHTHTPCSTLRMPCHASLTMQLIPRHSWVS
jgi:hypothetical protein